MQKVPRRLLIGGLGLGIGSAVLSGAPAGGEKEEDVSPAEDLMREHGVLKRVLLIYRHVIEQLDGNRDFPMDVVSDSAGIIRKFVEDYHEQLEEKQLFPRFRKAGKLVELCDTLETQHEKGRVVTDRTMVIARRGKPKSADDRRELRTLLYEFVRMYEPHEAREDTVLFPAFRKIVSGHEYDALGEEFEKQENQLFGGDGFEKNVAAVAALEKRIGLYDLSQFTPKV
jgi:hemerythrin-like domain-containing protein